MNKEMPDILWIENDTDEVVTPEMGYDNKEDFATPYIRKDKCQHDNWKETVRDIFDYTYINKEIAQKVMDDIQGIIFKRHKDYFDGD